MKRLIALFTVLIFTGLILLSCSDSGTGPSSDNEGNGNNSEGETTYSVDVSISPSESGSVSRSADGPYDEGETVELTAEASDEYLFSGWTGDMESEDNPLSLTVDQDYFLTANFEKKSYALTTNTEGEGAIDENVVQEKSKEYEHGTVVELTANPAKGYRFVEWKGDIEGSDNPAQITVDDPKDVTAVFEKKSYELTINTEGKGAVNEEVVQSKSYDHGTVVELTANAGNGYKFAEWTGDLSGSDNPSQITVDKAKEVTAVFGKKSFALTTNTSGSGSITKTPDQSTYEYETTVELEATPADGYKFVEWTGDKASTDNPVEITIDAEKIVTAVFEETQAKFYLAGNGVTIKCEEASVGESGTVNGDEYIKRTVDQITTDNAPTTCTSGITDMSSLFEGADSFNRDITHWDVSEVTRMNRMFTGVDLFNQDISYWDVSSVKNMDRMFWLASDFNQNLSGWCVKNIGATKPDDFDVGTHDDFEGNINKLPDWGAKCSGS
ncbi:InlB B-repeat-containing protein [Fodinibius sp. Rm-B-1B1-1]|uniref:InlB B-repeat-containing protein n=1 Tax=Fodinibius alkaliphilus TaxID=3140241 RepID=UPI00315ADCAA